MNKIFSYFSNETDLIQIKNRDIFKINNVLNNIDVKDNKLNIPTLVMIGSQSSGKSSLLNKLLNMEMLPTGSKMVTRTPLNLELINTNKDFYAEFGNFDDCKWTKIKTINLTYPKPLSDEIQIIKNYIMSLTKKYAGNEMNISNKEINIRIYSPNVININLIDLPGLTMIACTDKGQPADIKDQIQSLIEKYVKNPNNILLCVIPAREDIETDIALDFLKTYDKNGDRTLGILTKIDLMNKNTTIVNYLENNISKDLKVKYGYYAVNNNEVDDFNYFNTHEIYKELTCKEKFGIKNLGDSLSKILLENIKKSIPNLLIEIDNLYKKSIIILDNLGIELPTDKNALYSYLTKFIINFSSIFNNSIESKQEKINTGRLIKDIFINYRNELSKLDPFTKEKCSDKYLENIIKNSEGNHMSFPIPTIEVLENCLKDKSINCFNILEPISIECCDKIIIVLENLLNEIFQNNFMERFPKLNKLLVEDIKQELLSNYKRETHKKIKELILIESNYIWTDENEFLNILNSLSKNLLTMDILREILQQYYKTVINNLQNNIPKIIMYFIVTSIQNNIQVLLFNNITKNNYLDYLIEDKSIIDKRIKYKNIIENLKNAKIILSEIH